MKIYAYIAAALLLAGLLGAGVHIVRKASRVDAAEAAQAKAEKRAKDADQRAIDVADGFLKAAKADQATADELAGIRADMALQSLSFNQAIKSKPLTRETTHVENGQTVTCHERDPARYLELFNAAVKGNPVTSP